MSERRGSLIGREEQLALLGGAVVRSRGGGPAAVLVKGEAGIGKSRLIEEAFTSHAMTGDVVAYGHGVELSGGELPYGAVADSLRSLIRDLGADVVRDAAGAATSTLAALCPALGERGESIDQVQLYGGFVSTVETLATDRLLWLVFEDLHFTDATSRDLIGYLVRVANTCRLVIVMTTRLEELSEQPSLSRFVTDLSRVDRVTEITLAPWTRIEVEQQVTQLSPAQPTAGLLDRVAALAQGNPFLVEQLLTAGVDSTGPVPDSVLSLMQDRVARLGDETRRLVQMASLADGHVTHRLLQDVYAPKSSASGDVLALPIADAVGHHVLQFDPDSLTYSFVHALLREAVEASVPPADRLDWHRRWAEVISRQAQSDRDLSLQVAAAHHWAQAGADIEAFDAAIAAGQASYRIGANAEVGRLFARALRLWDRVPDPSGRAGVSRDQVLMDAVMSVAETIDPSGALALIDAELARERIAKGDRTRTLCLRLARAILDGPLRQPHDARVDAEGLQAMEPLISMDPSPLQIVALIRLGSSVWHTDPDRAHRIYQEAFLAAQELGDLRRQRWAGSTMATHLGCQGRMEAERGFSLNHAGRYREARAAIEHALSGVSDPPLCQHLFARAETSLCAVLFALGEWDQERSHLERLQELPPLPGDERVILARTAVQWACHRGDERAAQHWVDLAQANLPTDDGAIYLDTWVDVSWLTAETALARGDLISAREALMPLWDVPGYEMYWEAWHPVLLAARIEADLADQARTAVSERRQGHHRRDPRSRRETAALRRPGRRPRGSACR